MINGVHAVIFSKEAERVRDFCRDILELPSVDAGGGWLIFALPPAELGIHPAEGDAGESRHELYLMCDDIDATLAALEQKGVEHTPIAQAGFGRMTSLKLPDGSELGLYQPRHPTAHGA